MHKGRRHQNTEQSLSLEKLIKTDSLESRIFTTQYMYIIIA